MLNNTQTHMHRSTRLHTLMPRLWGHLLTAGLLVGICSQAESRAVSAEQATQTHQEVLSLKPVGYWPADEGEGGVLRDLSGNDNHGKLFNVPWRDGMLDFRAPAYQWVKIPANQKCQSPGYSLGGWIYSRSQGYRRDGALVFGCDIQNHQGFITGGGVGIFLRGMFRGSDPSVPNTGWPSPFAAEIGALLVNVASGEQRDAIGSLAADVSVESQKWQHLFYTYEPGEQEVTKAAGNLGRRRDTYTGGTGKLYLDGKLVHVGDGVPPGNLDGPLTLLRGFDGSGRDFTLFDHTLSADEVERLCKLTEPQRLSPLRTENEPVKSLMDDLNNWQTRVRAAGILARLHDNKARFALIAKLPEFVRMVQDSSLPDEERATAALVLREVHNYFAPRRGERFAGSQALYHVRAVPVGFGGVLVAAVPVLTETLEEIVKQEGARLPRIDDLLRNSIMRTLLDLAPDDQKVRELLGLALAKPSFDSLDLNAPHLAQVKPLVQNGKYMDALEVYRDHRANEVPAIRGHETWVSSRSRSDEKVPEGFLKRLSTRKPEHDTVFISQGNPWLDARMPGTNYEAYTSVATWNGATYVAAIERLTQDEVEKIYHEQLEKFASAGSDGAKGVESVGDLGQLTAQWHRLQLIKVDSNGQRETVFPIGDWFIFDVRDAKISAWSLGIDQDGRIHLMGGMHNRPNPGNYLPGVWAKLGLSTNIKDEAYPALMYWVSQKPGDITSFEFVGHADNPQNIPTPAQFGHPGGLNYINFVKNRKTGTLFCYGRVYVSDIVGGRQSLGLFRFDAKTRTWTTIGGNPVDIIKDCEEAHPGWSKWLIRKDGTSDKLTRTDAQVMAWAWQPHFYNYIRGWGVRFDRTGRMHVRMPLNALDGEGLVLDRALASEFYAFSDDEGDTWQRANGDPVKLPLTLNPAPKHNADIDNHGTRQWWELWESLLAEAGYSLKQPMNPGGK